jgi:AraC-like DNA-binding protein
MKFDRYLPSEILRPYIKYYVVTENELENEYKVFPSAGLVIGLQYKGQLSTIVNNVESKLHTTGITGIMDKYKVFKNSTDIGTVLIYFTETGLTRFTEQPAHELFNLSLSLDEIFDKRRIAEVEEKLTIADTDKERITIVEKFLIAQLMDGQTDILVVEATRIIKQSEGNIRIKDLSRRLFISQSPLEKRFRKVVGTSPKKFASIIRFSKILNQLGKDNTLTEICYENNFFDQSHFIKDFKQFTGETPENFNAHL